MFVPVLAVFSFAVTAIYRKGVTPHILPLAPVHLMDVMDEYDYSYFNTAYDSDKNYYDAGNKPITGEYAQKIGFGKDTDMLGADDYNAYLKSLLAEDNGIDELPTVVIAVVDSGINLDHEIFAGRVMVAYGRSFVIGDNGDNLVDALGHGTHVAGVICDTTLPNVKILPIKIFDGVKKIDPSEIIPPALEYIVELKEKGMNIVAVNMSLGTDPLTPADSIINTSYGGNYERYLNSQFASYQAYIDILTRAGILPIVAVGNGKSGVGIGSPYPSLPAACDGALAVSSFDAREFVNYDVNENGQNDAGDGYYWKDINNNGAEDTGDKYSALPNDEYYIWVDGWRDADGDGTPDPNSGVYKITRAGYSNYGSQNPYNSSLRGSSVDISAPGTNIWSARASGTTEMKLLSGTSQATPFVASAYAMLYSDPTKDWAAESKDGYLTSVEKALTENAMAIGSPGNMERDFGSGCVSLSAFIPSYSRVPITGTAPSGKAKITVAAAGGGMIMRRSSDILTPIGQYILVDKTDNFSGIVWAGGGYTILSVKIDGTEMYRYEEGADKLQSYTLSIPAADLSGSGVNVFVQFSAFSADELRSPANTAAPSSQTPVPIDLNPIYMMWVILSIAGVITVVTSLIKNRRKNAQAIDGGDDIEMMIRQMESRKRKSKAQTDLDGEVWQIMREMQERERQEEEEDGDT